MSQIFRKEKLNSLKKWIKKNKKSKFLNQLFLTWKKIRMDLLFSLAEIKFIQSNHGVFESFAINQSESSINYKKIFFCFDINQSESTFKGHGIFNKFYVSQSKMSSNSHGCLKNFDFVCRYQRFLHM